MKAKQLQAAVVLGTLALVAWPAIVPAPRSDFDYAAFARLQIFEGGRVKPVDGRTLFATRWLLDAVFKPEAADTYPAFVVDDPEVLGLLGRASGPATSPTGRSSPSATRYGTRPLPVEQKEIGRRSRFQTGLGALPPRFWLQTRPEEA